MIVSLRPSNSVQRTGPCIAALVIAIVASAQAAEVKKVWRDLSFDMTLDEAVTALGNLVQRRQTAAEQEAEMQRQKAPIDVATAIDSISRCIRSESEAGREIPPSVVEAQKVLASATKSRTWISTEWRSPGGGTAQAKLGGELKRVEPDWTITIQLGNGKTAVTAGSYLDQKSREFVGRVHAAARLLDDFRQTVADRDFRPAAPARIASPRELVIKPIDMAGLPFQPELRFTPHLSSIILKADGAKAPPEVFENLTETLRGSHGKEDEATKSDSGRQRIWRGKDATVILSQTVSTADVPVFSRAAGRGSGFTGVSTVTRNIVVVEYLNPHLKPFGDTMTKGQEIAVEGGLRSESGRHVLLLHRDGNLVLTQDGIKPPAWSSRTGGTGAVSLKLCDDGDLALLDASGIRVWNAEIGGRGGDSLVMQNDGTLVVYTKDRRAIWSTDTVRP
jgi:hypothetical protein